MMRFERRWASHVLGAFAPEDGPGLAPFPREVDYGAVLARMMREATPIAALGLRLAIWMAALAPLFLWGKLVTINSLARERRPALLSELLEHRLFAVRELSLLLKLCAAMALLGAPTVRARSGYDHVQAHGEIESGVRVRRQLPLVAEESNELRVWPGADAQRGERDQEREQDPPREATG